MRLNVTVTVAPDDNAPTVVKEASIVLGGYMLRQFLAGEYPERLQLLIEAAVPQMVRGAIKEAMAR